MFRGLGMAVASILLCCKSVWVVCFFLVFWHLKRNFFFTAWGRLQRRKWQGGKTKKCSFLARYSIWAKTHRCFSHLVSKSNKHIRVLEILVILSWKHISVFIVLLSIIWNTCVLFYLLGIHVKKKTQKKNTKKNTFIVLEMGANNTYVFLILGSLKMKNTYVLWDSWSKILKTQTCFL